MYLDFFDLKHRPFAITPDPEFMFWSAQHRTAYDRLKSEISRGPGVTMLAGQVGAGKTHIINALAQDADLAKTHWVLLLSNLSGGTRDVLRRLLFALNRKEEASEDLWAGAAAGLAEIRRGGLTPLLIADEAQTLCPEGAEVLARLARNKELGPLTILIAGQTELGGLIRRSGYRILEAELGASVSLSRLSCQETREYIRTRLMQAGATRDIFSSGAQDIIFDRSQGVPRLINKLCDALLFLGAQDDVKHFDAGAVRRILEDQIDSDLLGLEVRPEDLPMAVEPEIPEDQVTEPSRVLHLAAVDPAPAPRRRWPLPVVAACLIGGVIAFGLQFMSDTSPADPAPDVALADLEAQKLAIQSQIIQARQQLAQTRNTERSLAQQAQETSAHLAHLRAQVTREDSRFSLARLDDFKEGGLASALPGGVSKSELNLLQIPIGIEVSDLSAKLKPIAAAATPEAEIFFEEAVSRFDPAKVAIGYTRAALRGHDRAARYLGQMFETGDGVSFSPVIAARWYALADGGDASEENGKLVGAQVAAPLISIADPDGAELIWDGRANYFRVELADSESRIIGWFETRLTAARLDLPETAVSWRVRGGEAEASAWHPIGDRAPD